MFDFSPVCFSRPKECRSTFHPDGQTIAANVQRRKSEELNSLVRFVGILLQPGGQPHFDIRSRGELE